MRVLDYSFLTLGTYGTLREVEFIQDMNKMCPQIRGYYIGLYIPAVPKMLYKGKLQPSYLLCPEMYTWHLLNDGKFSHTILFLFSLMPLAEPSLWWFWICHVSFKDLLNLLAKLKYARFNPDPMAKAVNEFDPITDLNHLRLLVDNELCLSYNDYKQVWDSDDQFEIFRQIILDKLLWILYYFWLQCKNKAGSVNVDEVDLCEYGKAVGKSLSSRLYLVIWNWCLCVRPVES